MRVCVCVCVYVCMCSSVYSRADQAGQLSTRPHVCGVCPWARLHATLTAASDEKEMFLDRVYEQKFKLLRAGAATARQGRSRRPHFYTCCP